MASMRTEQKQRRADHSRDFAASRMRHGYSQRAIAEVLEVSNSHIASIEDPIGAKSLRAYEIPRLPEPMVLDQARGILPARYEIVRVDVDPLCVANLSTVRTIERGGADVLAVWLEALDDRELTDAELERMERELEKDIALRQRALADMRLKRAQKKAEKQQIAGLARARLAPLVVRKTAG